MNGYVYCVLCNTNNIEDEYHFVLICTKFNELRKRYIKRYYWLRPSVAKFCELMSNSGKGVLLNLAKYLVTANKERLKSMAVL